MSPSLYELAGEVRALDELLAELGGDVSGEQGQTLEAWAAAFEWQVKAKVDAYGALYRNICSDAEAIGAEIDRLSARRNVMMNRAGRLEALAKFSMERLGVRKVEGATTTISIRKAGGKDPVEILVTRPEDLPERFQKKRVDFDKEAVRDGLEKKDPELEGKARLGTRGDYILIK